MTLSELQALADVDLNILVLRTFFAPNAKPYCLGTSKRDLTTTHMWQWIPSGKPRRTHEIDAVSIPDFLTNWNHTMQLVEEIRARGIPVKLHFAPAADKVTASIRGYTVLEISMQRAICLAALLACK